MEKLSTSDAQRDAFSSSEKDVITRSLEVSSEETPCPGSSEFAAYYDVERTVRMIEEGDYKQIALQFPDELLHDSVLVYQALQERLGPQRGVYVLADTSYGSCCVDEVAASHVAVDVLVHYGHACLSQTSRLPVIYVFGRRNLNVEECVDKISAYLTGNAEKLYATAVLQLRYNVGFAHLSGDLVKLLHLAIGDRYRIDHEPLPMGTSPAPMNSRNSEQTNASSQSPSAAVTEPPLNPDLSHSERKAILWVGEESPTLTKILMTSSGSVVISYSPRSGRIQEQTYLTNKLLMRRYAILQKARDADVFGILIGTLGVASYLPLTKYLRQRLKKAHKKSYTVSVGKINPSKLANFMEIECWIWVSCSEGMVDSKEYLRPIITPYELELALQPEPEWTGKYIFDFQELLATASLDARVPTEDPDSDRPTFSLISGSYRHAKRYGDDKDKNGSGPVDGTQQLTLRSQDNALSKMADSAAAHFLQARSYQGLDPRLGQDTPSMLEQGRSGIARGYGDDHREDLENHES